MSSGPARFYTGLTASRGPAASGFSTHEHIKRLCVADCDPAPPYYSRLDAPTFSAWSSRLNQRGRHCPQRRLGRPGHRLNMRHRRPVSHSISNPTFDDCSRQRGRIDRGERRQQVLAHDHLRHVVPPPWEHLAYLSPLSLLHSLTGKKANLDPHRMLQNLFAPKSRIQRIPSIFLRSNSCQA